MTDSTFAAEPEDDARPRLSRRAWWAVTAGLTLLIAAVSAWAWFNSQEPVRWRDVGFSIDSPVEASATFDVFFYSDKPVTCQVHALNVRFAEVGTTTVTVDPAAGKQQRITATMATTESATTAVVKHCEPTS
mgnify:CR=1 FL=1|jgi:hypothetical protein